MARTFNAVSDKKLSKRRVLQLMKTGSYYAAIIILESLSERKLPENCEERKKTRAQNRRDSTLFQLFDIIIIPENQKNVKRTKMNFVRYS